MEDAALSTEDRAKAEHSRHAKKMDEKEQARRTAEAKDRIEERKAQRLVEAQLKGTKALGSVANDRDDDLLAWLSNHKTIKSDAGDGQQHADQQAAKHTNAEDGEEEDGANVAIKSSAVDMDEGETRILTLADANILGDDGSVAEDGDVLEDAGRTRAEILARKKKAAQKQSLHFEEDSKRLGILSKYDDEEEEALLSVGKDGNLDDDHVRAAIAARLQASAPALTGRAASGTVAADAAAAAAAAAAPPPAAREYLRTGEVGGGFRDKKGKKRKAGKTRRVRAEDDEAARDDPGAAGEAPSKGGKEGTSVFDELEASGVESETDRGSRASKRRREAEIAALEAAAEDEKTARYELALEKANRAASTAARRADVATGHVSDDDDDEEEKQLQATLAKAARIRETTQEGTPLEAAVLDEVAAEMAVPKSEKLPDDSEARAWHTTDTMAFIDSLNTLTDTAAEDQVMHDAEDMEKADEDAKMEPMDEDKPVPPKPPPRRPRRPRKEGGWEEDPNAAAELTTTGNAKGQNAAPGAENAENGDTAQFESKTAAPKRRMRGRRGADEDAERDKGDGAAASKSDQTNTEARSSGAAGGVKSEPAEDGNVLFELQKGLGRGLSEALVIVRERGWLNEVEYRGRVSDFKHNQKDLVEDALLNDDTELAHRVGASLQRKDEFGRILTPKEVFRDVSYAFHGYKRAASKIEKNLKSVQKSRAQAGLLDDSNVPYHQSVNPSQLLDDWKAKKWRPKWVNYGKNAKTSKKSTASRKGGLGDARRDGVSAMLDGSSKSAAQNGSESAPKSELGTGWAADEQAEQSVADLPMRGVVSTGTTVNESGDKGKQKASSSVLPPPPPPMELGSVG